MLKLVSIVNNGVSETVYDNGTGAIIYNSRIDNDSRDAIAYLDECGFDYKLVSYSCI